jgi:tungstate transport system permease protein
MASATRWTPASGHRSRRSPRDPTEIVAACPRARRLPGRAGGNPDDLALDLLWLGLRDAADLLLSADAAVLTIALLSLQVSLGATALAAVAGVPLGVALAVRRFRGQALVNALVNTGMGLPPVVVGLVVTIFLWRTGPFGPLALLYTPAAMVLAQLIVATPIVAGVTRTAIELLDRDVLQALRVDGAGGLVTGRELIRAAGPQVLLAVAAGFGRAISEVGASLMVGGNLAGQTRIMTTAITLETSRGEFARAIALGAILLIVAFAVNALLTWRARA